MDPMDLPIICYMPKDRRNPASTFLMKFARNVTSQNGEDGIIEKLLELIGATNEWVVEIGAWDGKHLSNSWNLINRKSWHGVLVEGSAQRCALLQKTYAALPHVTVRNAYVGFDAATPTSIDRILAETAIPRDFDVLSIDIDGNDYHVWQTLTDYRPRVVIIEYNPTAPNDVVFVQDADETLNQGCSLAALIGLGKRKGYELVCATVCNGIFVRAEDFPKVGIAENDIDSMRLDDGPRILIGYDGTVLTAGLDFLPWTTLKLDVEDLQILPKALRRYSYAPDGT
jgi:Methyltransferase FkbM domain